MSILAEPRRKQRISVDPRNMEWKNDDSKIGQRLMERMGWKEGSGLGKQEQGGIANVKLTANRSQKGLGAVDSYDTTWIAAHDDFADLLATLNKNKGSAEDVEEDDEERSKKISVELSSRSIRRRIHYQKFTKAKDFAQYSESDKSAIFGGKKIKQEEKKEIEERESEMKRDDESKEDSEGSEKVVEKEQNSLGQQLSTSSMSVAEYFAAKMAAIAGKRAAANESPSTEGEQNAEKKRKNKKGEKKEKEKEVEEKEPSEEEREEAKRKRKEDKKKRKAAEREAAQAEKELESSSADSEPPKKKKSKKSSE